MKVWTDQILPLALELKDMEFGPEMQPKIDELSRLGLALSKGVDADQNGTVEIAEGECGAEDAYNAGVWMADFPLFTGADRQPPTAVPSPQNN
jgi:hypothetical protein